MIQNACTQTTADRHATTTPKPTADTRVVAEPTSTPTPRRATNPTSTTSTTAGATDDRVHNECQLVPRFALRTVAVIPAKGTSRRLPGKNRRLLRGKPLVRYAIDAALSAGIDDVLVSSEADDILAIAEDAGATPVPRPLGMSGNYPDLDAVCRHTLRTAGFTGHTHDAVLHLLPTWPFRSVADIERAVELLASGLVSEVRSGTVIDRCSRMLLPNSYLHAWLLPDARVRIGAPVAGNSGPHVSAWIGIDRVRSIDIDDAADWARAEFAFDRFHFTTGVCRD